MIRRLLFSVLACFTTAQAADLYWDGSTSSSWADLPNWSTVIAGGTDPALVPGATDRVLFNADTFTNALTTLGAAQAAQGLVFNANAVTGVTLGTLNDFTLTLGNAGIDVQAGTHVINSKITVGANQIWANTGSGTLTTAGDIALNANLTLNGTGDLAVTGTITANGNRTLTIGNTGNVTFGNIDTNDTTARTIVINTAALSNVSVNGVISDSGNIHKDGAGTLTLNGANSFSGNMRILNGTVKVNTSNAAAGQLIFGEASGAPGSSGFGTLVLDTNSAVSFRLGASNYVHPTSDGAIITAGGGGAFAPTLALVGDRTFVVNETAAEIDLLVQVGIANGDGSNRTLTKQSIGTMVMQGANTYTGATTVERGKLVLDYSVNNGDNKLSNSAATVMRGGTLELQGNGSAPTAETVLSLSAPTGASTLSLISSNGQPLTLTATNGLSRAVNEGVLNILTNSANATLAAGGGSANNSFGFLGGWVTFNGDRWATRTAGNTIAAFAGSVQNDKGQWSATDNIVVDGATTGSLITPQIASLILDAPAGGPLAIDNHASALTVAGSAILVSADVTGDTAITGGQLLTKQSGVGATQEFIISNLSAGALNLAANLGGSSSPQSVLNVLTLAGAGEIHLTGTNLSNTNTITNGNNGRTNIYGNVRVSGGNALNDYGSLVFATSGDMTSVGAVLNLDGGTEGVGNISGGGGSAYAAQGSGEIRLGTGGTLIINQTANSSMNVIFTGSGTVIKRGSGILTSTNNAHEMTGELRILGGTVNLNGGAEGFVTLNSVRLRGGDLLIDHNAGSSLNRVNNSANVIMEGGGNGLRVTSNQAAARAETVGKLTLDGGSNTITVGNTVAAASITASTTTTLTFGATNPSLSRANGSTLLVRGDNLGGIAVAGSTAASRVTFTNTTAINAALVGTSTTAGAKNLKILPYAIGDTSSIGVGNSLLTYGGTNGLRTLTDDEYASDYSTATSDANLSLNTTATGLTSKTINALRVAATGGAVSLSGASGSSLTLTSGALLVSAGGTDNDVVIDGYDSLLAGTSAVGDDELIVHITSSNAIAANATLTINSAIANNGGATSLTKSGAGTLVLGGANTYTGATTVNNGVLEFGAAGGNLGSGAVRMAGGTLRWGAGNTTDITAGSRRVELLGASAYLTPNYGGNILIAGSVFDVGANDVTLANAIGNGGHGGLSKTGTGTLTLGAAPTYTGNTVIAQGAMNFQSIAPNTIEGLYLVSANGGILSSTVQDGLNLQSLIVGGVYNGSANVSGTLTVAGGAVNIGNGGGDDFILLGYRDGSATSTTTGATTGAADFRNASSVNINVSRIQLGTYLGAVPSPNTLTSTGSLQLSNTSNQVTANTIILGSAPISVVNSGAASTINLGTGVTTFHVDTFVIGGVRSRGDVTIGAGGSFTLRGQQGGSTGGNLFIADNDATGTGTGNTSSLNLTGAANVDMKLNLLVLGRIGTASSSSGFGRGTLTYGTGVIEATTIRMADVNYHDTANVTSLANTQGTINQQGTATMRFMDLSRGVGPASSATYSWQGGTIQNLAGANLLNQNVAITLAAGSGNATNPALRIFTVDAGQAATFLPDASFTGSRAFTKNGGGELILHGVNTNSGNLHLAEGQISLRGTGSMDDVAWIALGSAAKFDFSQRSNPGYAMDAVISGTGAIGGAGTTLTVGTNVGAVNSVGVLKPGGSTNLDTAAGSATVGNQTGVLTMDGNLILAGSGGVRVDRGVLQVGATNRNAATTYAGDISTWVGSIPTNHAAFMSGAGTNHDLIDVEGTLTLNSTGGLTVGLVSGYTGIFGDVFNILDWSTLDPTSSAFTVGDRFRNGSETGLDLMLPMLSGGLGWDTSLFLTQGVLVVVPEPGRALLMALGLMALLGRRCRR